MGAVLAQNAPTPPNRTAKPLTQAQLWALDKVFTDSEHGVTFRYPSVWKAGTDFAYHPPVLTNSDDAKIVAAFGYDTMDPPPGGPSNPYAGTDLEGFGFTYATADASNRTQCEEMAATLADKKNHKTILIGRRPFSNYEVAQAGMSQSTGGDLYVTFAGATCYFFETDTGWIAPGVADDAKTLPERQSGYIQDQLFKIMNSVKISPVTR